MQAVTPEPQVLTIGLPRSTPASANSARSASGAFIAPSGFSTSR